MSEIKSRILMEIKGVDEAGSFEGLLSPYGNVDDGGDVVEPGAYTKTINDHGAKVPLLWQHRSSEPIGSLMLSDSPEGLRCAGQLLMSLPEAQKAYQCIKAGIVSGLSIGFQAVKDSVEKGVRHLKEIRLYEGSIVTFPMNEAAQISSVKAGNMEDVQAWAEDLQSLTQLMERKAGAMISAANVAVIKAACGQIMAAHESMMSLCEGKAASGTLPEKADIKTTEPDNHSAILSLFDKAKETFAWIR
jgi:HK97 family phage prohead protease